MIAVPMFDPSSHDSGLASKTFARQAFWIVVRREGSAIGSATFVFAMPATPRPCEVTRTRRAAPSSLLFFASVLASKVGWKGRLAQLASWNGEDTLWLPLSACAVYGLTLSVERVTTLPNLNGPASAGMTTLRPSGAPPYAPVM